MVSATMSKALITKLIIFYSGIYGINPNLAISVAQTESKLNPNAIGAIGEVGLFQIRPEFAKPYTKKQLLDPVINIQIGIKKLIQAKKTCTHKTNNTWLVCYNVGLSGAKKIKHPSLFPYTRKIELAMREM